MADCKNHAMEFPEKSQNDSKSGSLAIFNRSSTSKPSSLAGGEITNKPLYSLYNSPAFRRSGSIKSLYSSSFGTMASAGNSLKGKVRKLCSIFESPKHPSNPTSSQSLPLSSPTPVKPTKLLLTASDSSNFISKGIPSPVSESPFRLPGTEDRVVTYFTSLRGIRRTFQDCHSVRMIFRGLCVNLDERDIYMDVAYRKELQKVLGETNISLPQVFIKGKYIGGAEVIKQLLEAGELVRLIKGLPSVAPHPCDTCSDVRFVPCSNCNGSKKVYDEDEETTKRCPECNENGLVRCPLCCS